MRRAIVAVLATWAFTAQLVEGQEQPERARRLTFAVGPLLVSQRDENASPLRYGGAGPFLQAAYTARTRHGTFNVQLGGAIGTLRSSLTDSTDVPRQRTWHSWLEVDYARVLSAPGSRTRWFLGARVAVEGTVIQHFYANAGGLDVGYFFVSAALGPVATVQRPMGTRGTMTAQLCAPVVALIARPYLGAIDLIPAFGVHVRGAALDEFQGIQLSAAYTTEVREGRALVFGYRLAMASYRHGQSFRVASQGVSVGALLRLGGRP